MQTGIMLGIAAALLGACNPTEVEFSPRSPGQHFAAREGTASRVHKVDVTCDEIGSFHVFGVHDDEIEAIAREVADQGGNKYVLRDPVGKGRRRNLSGIAYRCP